MLGLASWGWTLQLFVGARSRERYEPDFDMAPTNFPSSAPILALRCTARSLAPVLRCRQSRLITLGGSAKEIFAPETRDSDAQTPSWDDLVRLQPKP